MTSIRTCIFPVAGLGTRFLPATKSMPKEMLTVLDKPLIQYAVEEARASGIERFIFITSQGKSTLEDHFDCNRILEQTLEQRGKTDLLENVQKTQFKEGEAVYIRQSRPLGLGHAVLCAKNFVQDEMFAVILPDDLILSQTPCLQQLMNANLRTSQVVSVMKVAPQETQRYGVISIDSRNNNLYKARDVVEKPSPEQAPSNLAVVGRYLLNSEIFKVLGKQSSGAQGEIQLTDGIQSLIPSHGLYGLEFEGTRYDCGTKEGWLQANVAFAWKDPTLRSSLRSLISILEKSS